MERDQEGHLQALAVKISRLRKRLASYGWAEEEVASIIFHEFLKLPVIDWHKMDSTVDYYAVKEKYMVDAGTAELILCLKEMVPDLDMPNVGQYLLRILQYNTLAFGFDLADSSSDSNEPCRIRKVRSRVHQKRKKGNMERKKKHKEIDLCTRTSRKRQHNEDQNETQRDSSEREKQKKQEQKTELKVILTVRRHLPCSQSEDSNDKILSKTIRKYEDPKG